MGLGGKLRWRKGGGVGREVEVEEVWWAWEGGGWRRKECRRRRKRDGGEREPGVGIRVTMR